MSIEKHAEASITIKFDFDRATTGSAAGTGQLAAGVTIASAVVRVMKRLGGVWSDVSVEFIDPADAPALVDAAKAVTQRLQEADVNEQPVTRQPYAAICIVTGSDDETYVLVDDLVIVGTGRV